MAMKLRWCRVCVALGGVICIYGPLAWAQSDAVHTGPDWQQIALWFGGLIVFFVGLYAQWQRTAIAELKQRVGGVENRITDMKSLLDREYQTRQEVKEAMDSLGRSVDRLREILESLQRRLDFAGIPYQPK